MKTLKEAQEAIAAKQAALAKIFEEAGPDLDMAKVTSIEGDSATKAAEIRRLNDELTDLGAKRDELQGIADAAEKSRKWREDPKGGMIHPDGGNGDDDPNKAVKSIGELWIKSDAFKAFDGHNTPVAAFKDLSVKTLFQTGAGWAPETVRGPRVELTPERRLVVADLPGLTETNQTAIKYMEETTKTPAAAETAEAGTYPEAAFELTERTTPVEKIAVWIPVTDEQFEDELRAKDYINNRLVRVLNERLDSQLLVGNGSTPNLRGILNVSGIQTQAKGADPTPDAIYKAITLVRFTGYAEPDAIVLHPNDWEPIRLLRTADGVYIWGNPSERGPERMWGLNVVVTPAETQNTGLVGAFRAFSELAMKRGIEMKVSDSHSTFFIEGKLAIRADVRCAFPVYRAKAFCTVTGL